LLLGGQKPYLDQDLKRNFEETLGHLECWQPCLNIGYDFLSTDYVGGAAEMHRVDWPIIDGLLIEHLFIFYHMCFILSDLKCYASATSSSRNHL
jgi:hypothetical protein